MTSEIQKPAVLCLKDCNFEFAEDSEAVVGNGGIWKSRQRSPFSQVACDRPQPIFGACRSESERQVKYGNMLSFG